MEKPQNVKILGIALYGGSQTHRKDPKMPNGLVFKLMEYALYLGIAGQLGDVLVHLRREAARSSSHGLISLGTLNDRLVGKSK